MSAEERLDISCTTSRSTKTTATAEDIHSGNSNHNKKHTVSGSNRDWRRHGSTGESNGSGKNSNGNGNNEGGRITKKATMLPTRGTAAAAPAPANNANVAHYRQHRRQQRRTRACTFALAAAARRGFVGTVLFALLSLALMGHGPMLPGVDAQQVGVDICACQPATYEFVFNFSLTCDDSNIGGDGVQDSACVLNTENDQNVTDFTPVIVTRILILELNQNFGVIAQTPVVGDYTNGTIFRYTSVIASQDTSTLAPEDVPKGIQLSMAGRNKDEQDLVNFWLILYDNDCGFYPVVLEGQRIGWTILVRVHSVPLWGSLLFARMHGPICDFFSLFRCFPSSS